MHINRMGLPHLSLYLDHCVLGVLHVHQRLLSVSTKMFLNRKLYKRLLKAIYTLVISMHLCDISC